MKRKYHEVYKRIGNNLKRIRKAKGWTINHAARKASLSWGHYKSIEDGKCKTTIRIAYKIVEGWDISMVDIVKPAEKRGRGK